MQWQSELTLVWMEQGSQLANWQTKVPALGFWLLWSLSISATQQNISQHWQMRDHYREGHGQREPGHVLRI